MIDKQKLKENLSLIFFQHTFIIDFIENLEAVLINLTFLLII